MTENTSYPSYWYIDLNTPEEERKMQVACVECNVKHKLNGWYWRGDIHGYGEYDVFCSKCGVTIHKHEA